MRTALVVSACGLAGACTAARKSAPVSVLCQVDRVLGRTREVGRFEGRWHELGATITKGATADEWTATVALPSEPGYFPPRTLRVVYVITDLGLIVLKTVEVTSLGPRFAGI